MHAARNPNLAASKRRHESTHGKQIAFVRPIHKFIKLFFNHVTVMVTHVAILATWTFSFRLHAQKRQSRDKCLVVVILHHKNGEKGSEKVSG
jgi:hypothetical protein